LFGRAKLPVVSPDLGVEKYLELMGLDKKVEGGKIRFVLLKQIGHAVIYSEVPPALLQQTLEACCGGVAAELSGTHRHSPCEGVHG
jgi:3-dehydroquinate synthase